MKVYEIWSEGYRATCERGDATFHGTAIAESFKAACIKRSCMDPAFAKYFNDQAMTYWGCRLFDNEQDARKSFG